jgi:hypothetical protein
LRDKGLLAAKIGAALLVISILAIAPLLVGGVSVPLSNDYRLTIGAMGVAYAATPDYVCDGAADDLDFAAALLALPATGGELYVLAGDYVFANTVTATFDNVTIMGTGSATVITTTGAIAPFDCTGFTSWTFASFSCDNAPTYDKTYGVSSSTIVDGIWVAGVYTVDFPSPERTVRTASVVISASDATASEKAQADYVCDGTADQIEIQAAIDSLTTGGTLLFSNGTFYPEAYITMSASDNIPMTFKGQGSTTVISYSKNDLAASSRQLFTNYNGVDRYDLSGITFKNLKFVDQNEIGALESHAIGTGLANNDSMNSRVLVEDCEFDHCGIRIANVNVGGAVARNNYVHDIAGDVTTNAAIQMLWNDSPSITNGNVIDTTYDMGVRNLGCTDVSCTSNTIIDAGAAAYGIDSNTSIRVVITGNIIQSKNGILSEDDIGPITIDDNHILGILTVGNGIYVYRASINAPYQAIVTNNTIASAAVAIYTDSVADILISQNKVRTAGTAGIIIKDTDSVIPRKIQVLFNDIYDYSDQSATQSGIWCNVDNASIIGNQIDGNHNTTAIGIKGNSGVQSHTRILDNTILNVTTPTSVIGTGAEICGNVGYIASGELRTYSMTITAGVENTTTYFQNPFAQNVWVKEITFQLTTACPATNPTYDVKLDVDGTGVPSGTAFLDGVIDTLGTYWSWSNVYGTPAYGVQTSYTQLASNTSTSDWIGFCVEDAAGVGIAGKVYITIMGQ